MENNFIVLGIHDLRWHDTDHDGDYEARSEITRLVARVRMIDGEDDSYVDEDFPLPDWIQHGQRELAEQYVADAVQTRLGELRRGISHEESFLNALLPQRERIDNRPSGVAP